MDVADFLSQLDPDARRRAASRAYVRGETLFRRGDAPKFMFYVSSGEARLSRSSPDGAEIVVQRARRSFLAEASLDQDAYHCDGVVAADAEILAIPRADFRRALSSEPFQRLWLRHLGDELRRARARGERLALRTARERIAHYVETEGCDGTLILTQSKKSWAAEMGLTHEALYRALTAMARDGAAEVSATAVRLRARRPP